MPPQAKGAATDVAAEALAVEEEALGAQSLHHVHPLAAEMADVAAAEPGAAVLTRHTLKKGGIAKGHRFSVKSMVSKRHLQGIPATASAGVFKQPHFAH